MASGLAGFAGQALAATAPSTPHGAPVRLSALDCPAFFALHGDDMKVSYLARQQVEVLAPIRTDVEYVVVGRPLERSGRKGLAATAVLDLDGSVLAHAECLFVPPRS